MRAATLLLLTLALVGGLATPAAARPEPASGGTSWMRSVESRDCRLTRAHPRPVVLVHGLLSRAAQTWSSLGPRLAADGACTYVADHGIDPRVAGLGDMAPGGTTSVARSARDLAAVVAAVRDVTGAREVDLVTHSAGGLVAHRYLTELGGAEEVASLVALAPLWQGSALGGLDDLTGRAERAPILRQLVGQLCTACTDVLAGSELLADVEAAGLVVTGVDHVNVVTRLDQAVVPWTSGLMGDGAVDLVVQDLCPANRASHAGLLGDRDVAALVLAALADPDAAPDVDC